MASIVQTAITLVITLAFFLLRKPTESAPDVAYFHLYGLMAILGTAMILLVQVVGVAAFGTLFLSLTPSAHAITVTSVGLAATAFAAGVFALPLLRGR